MGETRIVSIRKKKKKSPTTRIGARLKNTRWYS